MTKPPVSVWILVARTDLPYMMQTIPHLMRSCNYPFVERVLAMDTVPLTGDKRYRYKTGTQEELESACQTLIEQGVMDKIVKIDYTPSSIAQIYQKYFGVEQASRIQHLTHNWKGSTIYASLYCIEAAASDYYLHFDADMLLYQDPEFDWIAEAIRLIDSIPYLSAMRPLSGPPHPEGEIFQTRITKDPRGFYTRKFFSMRSYLLSRQRFAQLSPIPALWRHPPLLSRHLPQPLQSWSGKFERRLRGGGDYSVQGSLDSFEFMVSRRFQETEFVRADLLSEKAWTLHPPDHGPKFVEVLPHLIQLIESGKYPLQQAGIYDLHLDVWLPMLAALSI
jgi:hypothetical protein